MYLPWPGEMSVRNHDGKWINVPAKDAHCTESKLKMQTREEPHSSFVRGEEVNEEGEDEPLIDKNC